MAFDEHAVVRFWANCRISVNTTKKKKAKVPHFSNSGYHRSCLLSPQHATTAKNCSDFWDQYFQNSRNVGDTSFAFLLLSYVHSLHVDSIHIYNMISPCTSCLALTKQRSKYLPADLSVWRPAMSFPNFTRIFFWNCIRTVQVVKLITYVVEGRAFEPCLAQRLLSVADPGIIGAEYIFPRKQCCEKYLSVIIVGVSHLRTCYISFISFFILFLEYFDPNILDYNTTNIGVCWPTGVT